MILVVELLDIDLVVLCSLCVVASFCKSVLGLYSLARQSMCSTE